ncbi:hypothetical protein RS86_00159 [Microbacterium azadirachtae]|uniref:Uncharacterized protein n=1 Tax=Microbacterium azadirachtae TaxID=582680 RepID=A0A0F0LW36_9MICO|nr:hypothetical protein RS86_00159 [Microbacterium azadirachtae]
MATPLSHTADELQAPYFRVVPVSARYGLR